ncbi:hypothetical protein ATSB10_01920 [Dyella thiooxydans]|uniref:Uncharacterized protein n=1 Tax=Dyella thiooxydans TaxID=445710 RepID=A0A160MWZ8_9GAMM|nr:hypothetical protein ATSB10_01920 [Dyella thiooxydans]
MSATRGSYRTCSYRTCRSGFSRDALAPDAQLKPGASRLKPLLQQAC